MTSIMTQPHCVVRYAVKNVNVVGDREHVVYEVVDEMRFNSFVEALADYKKLTFTPDGICKAEIKVATDW